jgi:hypothetical protein
LNYNREPLFERGEALLNFIVADAGGRGSMGVEILEIKDAGNIKKGISLSCEKNALLNSYLVKLNLNNVLCSRSPASFFHIKRDPITLG